MTKLKQSFSWWCVANKCKDPVAFLRDVRKLGYDGVEMVPPDLFDAAHEAGLTIATEIGHASIPDGLNRRQNHGRIEDVILKKLDLAVKQRIPNLICFSGNRGGLTDEAGAVNTADGLSRVAGAAEARGVTLVLELLNSKVDHIDYQCDHTAWGVMVCRMVNSPRVKLLYDIYHMQIMEGDIIRTVREHLPEIGHFHTGGVPGRHEIDGGQELNCAAIATAIADAGFGGYVAHEFVPVRDPLTSLREAVATCTV